MRRAARKGQRGRTGRSQRRERLRPRGAEPPALLGAQLRRRRALASASTVSRHLKFASLLPVVRVERPDPPRGRRRPLCAGCSKRTLVDLQLLRVGRRKCGNAIDVVSGHGHGSSRDPQGTDHQRRAAAPSMGRTRGWGKLVSAPTYFRGRGARGTPSPPCGRGERVVIVGAPAHGAARTCRYN